MNLEPVFLDIETDAKKFGRRGSFQRRLLTESQCDLFLGVELPGAARIFSTRFSRQAMHLPPFAVQLNGIEITASDVQEDNIEYTTVRLKLLNLAFADLFTNLAEDIAQHVASMPDESTAAGAFIVRLNKWRKFFEGHGPEGLSTEQRRGLYGELKFLCDTVLECLSPLDAVSSWTGPDGTAKDFQFQNGVACEVKTSASKAPRRIHVNGEAQLDDFSVFRLYLDCLFVDENRIGGASLPDQVAAIRALLSNSFDAAGLFEDKLLLAGYLDIHAERYQSTTYVDIEAFSYQVSEGFPRIVSAQLAPGVGDVQYVLALDACAGFSIDRSSIKTAITGE